MSSLGCHPLSRSLGTGTRNNQTSLRIKMDQLTFITRHIVINLFTGVKYHQAGVIFLLYAIVTDNFLSVWHANAERKSICQIFCEYKNSCTRAEKLSVMMTLVTSVCRGRRVATHWDWETRGLKLVLAIGWCRGAGAYSWEPLIIPHIPVWAGLCREFLENVSETEYLYSWRSCFGRIRTNTGLVTGIMLYAFKVILRVPYRILFVWALCDRKWAWLNA